MELVVKTDRRRTYTSWPCQRSWSGSPPRPAGAGPWTPQRRPMQRRRLSTCSAAAPSELERQEAPTILVACLINSHSQSEGLRIVRAPYACVLVGSRFVDSGLVWFGKNYSASE